MCKTIIGAGMSMFIIIIITRMKDSQENKNVCGNDIGECVSGEVPDNVHIFVLLSGPSEH